MWGISALTCQGLVSNDMCVHLSSKSQMVGKLTWNLPFLDALILEQGSHQTHVCWMRP